MWQLTMETTQWHCSTRQHLQAQQGIKHKCGQASAFQIQTKGGVWHLNYAIPQLGIHFDKHGHFSWPQAILKLLEDSVFWRNCGPMHLATQPFLPLNIPPFLSSAVTCNMHFIMPTVFAWCTAQSTAMLVGMFLGGLRLIISEYL